MSEQLKEHFRGVVWPRQVSQDQSGKQVYRYAIVGMLVTDTPIEGLHPNETVIDSTMFRHVSEMGMAGAIERAQKFTAPYLPGDANHVLLSLEDIVGEPYKPKKAKKPRSADPMCKCDNCGHKCRKSKLEEATHLEDRLDYPLDDLRCIVPDGDCPKCGCLSYEIKAAT